MTPIFLCKAKQEAASQVVSMLNMFEYASGQKINVEKFSIFFSKNVQQEEIENMCHTLRIAEIRDNANYLGLPNMLGRRKSSDFGFLKNCLRDRIQ